MAERGTQLRNGLWVREVRQRENLADDDAVEKWASQRTEGQPFILVNLKRERSGTHEPVWVALEELPGLDIRPRALGALLTP